MGDRAENRLLMKRFTEIHMRDRDELLRRARKLAVSGEFSRWYEIEFHLRYNDRLPRARDLFEDRSIREFRAVR